MKPCLLLLLFVCLLFITVHAEVIHPVSKSHIVSHNSNDKHDIHNNHATIPHEITSTTKTTQTTRSTNVIKPLQDGVNPQCSTTYTSRSSCSSQSSCGWVDVAVNGGPQCSNSAIYGPNWSYPAPGDPGSGCVPLAAITSCNYFNTETACRNASSANMFTNPFLNNIGSPCVWKNVTIPNSDDSTAGCCIAAYGEECSLYSFDDDNSNYLSTQGTTKYCVDYNGDRCIATYEPTTQQYECDIIDIIENFNVYVTNPYISTNPTNGRLLLNIAVNITFTLSAISDVSNSLHQSIWIGTDSLTKQNVFTSLDMSACSTIGNSEYNLLTIPNINLPGMSFSDFNNRSEFVDTFNSFLQDGYFQQINSPITAYYNLFGYVQVPSNNENIVILQNMAISGDYSDPTAFSTSGALTLDYILQLDLGYMTDNTSPSQPGAGYCGAYGSSVSVDGDVTTFYTPITARRLTEVTAGPVFNFLTTQVDISSQFLTGVDINVIDITSPVFNGIYTRTGPTILSVTAQNCVSHPTDLDLQQLVETYTVSYSSTTATRQDYIGPQPNSIINTTSITNCYGDVITFTPVTPGVNPTLQSSYCSYSGNPPTLTCNYLITVTSACRTVDDQGNTFLTCSGNSTTLSPLDGRHDVPISVYTCNTDSNGQVNCGNTPLNNTEPPTTVKLQEQVYPAEASLIIVNQLTSNDVSIIINQNNNNLQNLNWTDVNTYTLNFAGIGNGVMPNANPIDMEEQMALIVYLNEDIANVLWKDWTMYIIPNTITLTYELQPGQSFPNFQGSVVAWSDLTQNNCVINYPRSSNNNPITFAATDLDGFVLDLVCMNNNGLLRDSNYDNGQYNISMHVMMQYQVDDTVQSVPSHQRKILTMRGIIDTSNTHHTFELQSTNSDTTLAQSKKSTKSNKSNKVTKGMKGTKNTKTTKTTKSTNNANTILTNTQTPVSGDFSAIFVTNFVSTYNTSFNQDWTVQSLRSSGQAIGVCQEELYFDVRITQTISPYTTPYAPFASQADFILWFKSVRLLIWPLIALIHLTTIILLSVARCKYADPKFQKANSITLTVLYSLLGAVAIADTILMNVWHAPVTGSNLTVALYIWTLGNITLSIEFFMVVVFLAESINVITRVWRGLPIAASRTISRFHYVIIAIALIYNAQSWNNIQLFNMQVSGALLLLLAAVFIGILEDNLTMILRKVDVLRMRVKTKDDYVDTSILIEDDFTTDITKSTVQTDGETEIGFGITRSTIYFVAALLESIITTGPQDIADRYFFVTDGQRHLVRAISLILLIYIFIELVILITNFIIFVAPCCRCIRKKLYINEGDNTQVTEEDKQKLTRVSAGSKIGNSNNNNNNRNKSIQRKTTTNNRYVSKQFID
jgi:hypothetical protein